MLKFLSSVVVSVALSVGAILGVVHSVPKAKPDYSPIRQATWRLDIQTVGFFGEPVSGSCSGTFIKPHVVLTAAHCDVGSITIGGQKAIVLKKDVDKDLMTLFVDLESPVVEVAFEKPSIDMPVVLVGYPFGVAQYVTEGRMQGPVSIPEEMGIKTKLVAISALASPGNSGGGLYVVDHGHFILIGVLSRGGGSVSLAVAPEELKEFLK